MSERLAIIDWGIGGVGVYNALKKFHPYTITYFSDAGYEPYGKVKAEELKTRLDTIINYLKTLGIDKIAIACNAASTVIQEGRDISHIITHGIELINQYTNKSIGIIGGKRTIDSNIYSLNYNYNTKNVKQRIAQPLSAHIEAGNIYSKELTSDLDNILKPFSAIDYLLLACTHYPVIKHQITKRLNPSSQILDPAAQMAEWIHHNWDITDEGEDQWLTTGSSTEMKEVMQKVYHFAPTEINELNIS